MIPYYVSPENEARAALVTDDRVVFAVSLYGISMEDAEEKLAWVINELGYRPEVMERQSRPELLEVRAQKWAKQNVGP